MATGKLLEAFNAKASTLALQGYSWREGLEEIKVIYQNEEAQGTPAAAGAAGLPTPRSFGLTPLDEAFPHGEVCLSPKEICCILG